MAFYLAYSSMPFPSCKLKCEKSQYLSQLPVAARLLGLLLFDSREGSGKTRAGQSAGQNVPQWKLHAPQPA